MDPLASQTTALPGTGGINPENSFIKRDIQTPATYNLVAIHVRT
jgi:hypothetical protein